MGAESFIICSREYPAIRLRTAGEQDLENLRKWKNANRKSFFYQNEISPGEQVRWFDGFRGRENDFMFVVEECTATSARSFGCVGFRILDDVIDIYNIIRGEHAANAEARMSDAVRIMCSYARSLSSKQIACKVLVDNSAVEWYLGIGFAICRKNETYYDIDLEPGRFQFCTFTIEGLAV
jgi:hypothetical protein